MRKPSETTLRPAVYPVVLAVLDGWGEAKMGRGNAVRTARTPFLDKARRSYPYSLLHAHGRYVGLLPDQEGNSEAGHMNIGAGRIVRQEVITVSESIKDHTFFKNTAFHETVKHAKEHGSMVHVMGLLSNGNSAHSHPAHLYALLKLFRDEGVPEVRVHLFTDGRDSMPYSSMKMLRDVEAQLSEGQRIASVMGRFYAMDRNKLWRRTSLAYDAIVCGEGLVAPNAHAAIQRGYNRGESDEFLIPTVITDEDKRPIGQMKDNDVLFFFNLRSDRARQLTKCFVQEDFELRNEESFERCYRPSNIRFCAMSEFGPDLPNMYTAFPSIDITHGVTETLAPFRQFYIAESEKYAHVTYFMNGGSAVAKYGEQRMRVPSQFVPHHDMRPEMRAPEITGEVVRRLKADMHDFYVLNFANADMVGHTGNLKATVQACETVDTCLGQIAEQVLAKKGALVIVSDHGNAETKVDPETGEVMTEHTVNPVPFHIVCDAVRHRRVGDGMLADVVPTILEIMDIPKPAEMTGFTLLR